MTKPTKNDFSTASHRGSSANRFAVSGDLAAQVDAALRDEVARLRTHRALRAMLNSFEAERPAPRLHRG
jgi:hypothetical protein